MDILEAILKNIILSNFPTILQTPYIAQNTSHS
jgi:hypothetical protein